MIQYTIEEITEALAGATITGDVIHRLTSKKASKRYFIVTYTATRGAERLSGMQFLVLHSSEYLPISQFIDDTKTSEGFDFVVPTNIIELSESDYNNAKS